MTDARLPGSLEKGDIECHEDDATEASALLGKAGKDASGSDGNSSSMLGLGSLAAVGPALVCCLADGDAASLIVAAQSGRRWHYSLTLVQILLVPILFSILEAIVRTGVSERRGFGAMVRGHFGKNWAVCAMVLLLISCFGAIISQLSGISSVGRLWGMSPGVSCLAAAVFVINVVVFCNYRQVEMVALFFGLFELVFVVVLFYLLPPAGEVFHGMISMDFKSPAFLKMLAANIGAVVLPWMIYFQQSAVVAKKMRSAQEVAQERTQSLLGSIMAQLIMVATMMVMASVKGVADLEGVFSIQEALHPIFGVLPSKILVSIAFLGGCMCAVFVASLAGAWAVCDTISSDTTEVSAVSLDMSTREAPRFYASFVGIVCLGAVVVLINPEVVFLNTHISMLNAVMVPMILMFLYLVVTGPAMNANLRITGLHKGVLCGLFVLTSVVALVSSCMSLIPDNNDGSKMNVFSGAESSTSAGVYEPWW